MSATTKERYARRRQSEANKLSQKRATAWSDSEDDRPVQMEDGRSSDVDSQIGSQASDASEGQAAERPVERPATPSAPAAILVTVSKAI